MNDAYLQLSVDELVAEPAVFALVHGGRDAAAWEALAREHPDFGARLAEARRAVAALSSAVDYDALTAAPAPLDDEAEAVWRFIARRTAAAAPPRRARRPAARRSRYRRWATVALAAAAAVALIVMLLPGRAPERYSTGAGEQLAVGLPDGSTVTLGPASELRVESFDGQRRVRLAGEAFFDVERGGPFSVVTERGRVAVLGTTFTVDATAGELGVACATGRVAVVAAGDSLVLTPGRGARSAGEGLVGYEVAAAEVGRWRTGTIAVQDRSLAYVAATLERYYGRAPELSATDAARRVTVELPADDFAGAVARLEFVLQSPIDTTGGGLRFR